MARNNIVDTVWRIGPIEEAARLACQLIGDLRTRPVAGTDMAMVFSNLMEILSEMGRLDEAAAVAREAIPIMRRSRNWFLEGWVYTFWRCGHVEAAVRLLGKLDAQHAGSAITLQANERRLIAQVRAALAENLSPVELSNGSAQGAGLSETEVADLIFAALDTTDSAGRRLTRRASNGMNRVWARCRSRRSGADAESWTDASGHRRRLAGKGPEIPKPMIFGRSPRGPAPGPGWAGPPRRASRWPAPDRPCVADAAVRHGWRRPPCKARSHRFQTTPVP
jgi:hypothetical protein